MKKKGLRIKITDLPKDQKINRQEMRRLAGGLASSLRSFDPQPEPPGIWGTSQTASINPYPSIQYMKW
jgi:hypothetical protein